MAESGVSPVDRAEDLSRSTRQNEGPRPPRGCCARAIHGLFLTLIVFRAQVRFRDTFLAVIEPGVSSESRQNHPVQEPRTKKQHDVNAPEARFCGLPPQEDVC